MVAKTQRKMPDKADIELENLRNNRTFRFKEILGDKWPADDIVALVNSSHHPTDLQKLLDKGCPPRTAIRILI